MVGHLALSRRVTFVVQPSSTIFTCQSLFLGSRHPLSDFTAVSVEEYLTPGVTKDDYQEEVVDEAGATVGSWALGGSARRRRSTG